MKKIALIVILSIMLFNVLASPVFAAPDNTILNDTFKDTSKVDLAKTTAFVDTENRWVQLAKKNLANSIILYKDDYDVTLINGTAIETYQHNGLEMVLDTSRSVNGGLLQEPISIAGREGEFVVLDRGAKLLMWYHYDGDSMIPNGILSNSQLIDPRAIAVYSDTYDVAFLDRNFVYWRSFDGVGLAPNNYLSFNTGNNSNPVSLAIENDNYACVVLDKSTNEIRHYSFNGNMGLDNSRSIRVPGELLNPKSISISEDGGTYFIIDDTSVKAYSYDGDSMVYNSYISQSGFINPVAIAVKPDSYDYAVLDENNGDTRLRYFAFNGSSMEEIPDLGISGLERIGYGNNQILHGKAVTRTEAVSGLKLRATAEIPEGTSITWEVTVDGVNWKSIVPGGDAVRFDTPGTRPNYRAILSTIDIDLTPRIFNVQLVDSTLTIDAYAEKGEYRAGEALILYADTEGGAEKVEAIMWWTGGNDFTTMTATNLSPTSPISYNQNKWYTRHDYPINYDRVVIIPKDMPDGTYTVLVRATKGERIAEDTITIEVVGSQFNRIITEL